MAVISEVDFLVPDFLQTPRATWNQSQRQKDGYDLVTHVGLHHRNGRAPQKPHTVRPAVQQSLECDGGGRKNARERNYLVKGLPGPDVGKNATVESLQFQSRPTAFHERLAIDSISI